MNLIKLCCVVVGLSSSLAFASGESSKNCPYATSERHQATIAPAISSGTHEASGTGAMDLKITGGIVRVASAGTAADTVRGLLYP